MRKYLFAPHTIIIVWIAVLFLGTFGPDITNESSAAGQGPVSYWTFDEGIGTTANDSVGTNHGEVEGASWTGGLIDGALSFDGIDDGVRIADDVSLRPLDVTYSAWINPRDFANVYNELMAFMRDAGAFRGSFLLYVSSSGRPGLQMQNGSAVVVAIESTESLALDEWTFLTATYDGSVARLYVNGVEDANAAYSGGIDYGAGPRELEIGGDLLGFPGWFDGLIDEPAVFDRALSQEEIQNLYRGLLTLISLDPPTATNTIGEDHTVAATVSDLAGDPSPDVAVSFRVTDGPNAGEAGADTTDGNGEATFTYGGDDGAGTDTIEACFVPEEPPLDGIESSQQAPEPVCATATKTWVEPERTATPAATASPTPTAEAPAGLSLAHARRRVR